MKRRAESSPKPLFYHPAFIDKHLSGQPNDGVGVDREGFAQHLFPLLLEDRKPRYERFAENYGFSIDAERLFGGDGDSGHVPDTDAFLKQLYELMSEKSAANTVASDNAHRYLKVCQERARVRALAR